MPLYKGKFALYLWSGVFSVLYFAMICWDWLLVNPSLFFCGLLFSWICENSNIQLLHSPVHRIVKRAVTTMIENTYLESRQTVWITDLLFKKQRKHGATVLTVMTFRRRNTWKHCFQTTTYLVVALDYGLLRLMMEDKLKFQISPFVITESWKA